MSDHGSGYKHNASDKKLDQAAEAAKDVTAAKGAKGAKDSSGPGHDPSEIAKHDDSGKDRLFEHREQHDDAEMKSEKTRTARDVDRHHHDGDHTDKNGASGSD